MMRLVISDKEFFGFVVDNLSLCYNTIASTFGFSGLDDYSPIPCKYPKTQIYLGDELLLTGVIVNQQYQQNPKPTLVSVSGYSKAGVLEDCTIPISAMPMQLDNMSLKEICDKLFPLYDISYTYENIVKPLMFKKFEKTNFDYDKPLKSIIVDLATERGIYVNHLPDGQVRFTDSSTDNLEVVEHFEDDGVTEMSLDVNGQQMHSSITVLSSTDDTSIVEGEYTISNPYVQIKRPIIHRMKKGDSMDIKEYARFLLGAELRAITLKISTTKFIKPGNVISVKSKKLKLPRETIFFVEKTDVSADKNGLKYELSCVIKDVYSKKAVKNEFI